MYARFYRWAGNRLTNQGVLAFITNRSFIDETDSEGGSSNPLKYSRGTSKEWKKGVSPLLGDSKKVIGGGGNTNNDNTEIELSHQDRNGTNITTGAENGQFAGGINESVGESVILAPRPQNYKGEYFLLHLCRSTQSWIPPKIRVEAWEYKLGNRCALEWVLD